VNVSSVGVMSSFLVLDANARCDVLWRALEFPNTDNVVVVTSEEGHAVLRPAQTRALGWLAVLTDFDLELFDELLEFQVPNFDRAAGGGAKPVSVGAEDELGDLLLGIKTVKGVGGGLTEVPELGGTVFATRGSERTIRRNGD